MKGIVIRMIGINFFAQDLTDLLPILILGGSAAAVLVIGFLLVYFRKQIIGALGVGGVKKTIIEQEIEQRLVQIR